MNKIQMTTPIVEMDGDEMTRILWQMIKDKLILPYVDLKTEYFDLGLKNRDLTNDNITIEASEAAIRLGVAVKCATITPNAARKVEYNLKSIWKSPNGTIRRLIGGTCFRKPILINGIEPYIPTWKKPITIARHAYGDIYQNTESQVKSGSKAELVITDPEGKETRSLINSFSSDGIVQGVFNTDSSIRAFADSCFEYALEEKEDLWFATKDTISKTYDRRFRDIFQQEYDNIYKVRFEDNGITYFYTLIDDAVSRAVRSEGGFLWAMKNYDGDVLSDLLATAYGSLGLMTSVLVSPEHVYEYEAAHGTVTRHYYKYLKGEKTSTNPIATIFAWTGALRKRGEKDNNSALQQFADALESASISTIEDGVMDNNLLSRATMQNKHGVETEAFIDEIKSRIQYNS